MEDLNLKPTDSGLLTFNFLSCFTFFQPYFFSFIYCLIIFYLLFSTSIFFPLTLLLLYFLLYYSLTLTFKEIKTLIVYFSIYINKYCKYGRKCDTIQNKVRLIKFDELNELLDLYKYLNPDDPDMKGTDYIT